MSLEGSLGFPWVPWPLVVSCSSQAGYTERPLLQIPRTPFVRYKKKTPGEDLVVVKFKKASAELGGISLSTK